jgi:hypothetical protein
LSSSGIVTGTPTVAGTYGFTVQVTDAAARSAVQAFSVSVLPLEPAITRFSPTTALAGTPVTITGVNFGATQGSGTVMFGGVPAPVQSGAPARL